MILRLTVELKMFWLWVLKFKVDPIIEVKCSYTFLRNDKHFAFFTSIIWLFSLIFFWLCGIQEIARLLNFKGILVGSCVESILPILIERSYCGEHTFSAKDINALWVDKLIAYIFAIRFYNQSS